jgi:hypothetical protein
MPSPADYENRIVIAGGTGLAASRLAPTHKTTVRPGASALCAAPLRHAHAVEMAREGVPPIVIQRQLGQTNLGITSIYLQGIDNTEIIDTSTPAARRWSPSIARLRIDATTGGGKAAPCPPPALAGIAGQNRVARRAVAAALLAVVVDASSKASLHHRSPRLNT